MHHRIPPSKTGWPSLNVVIFPPEMRLVLDDTKQWPGDYWSNSRANLRRPPDFGLINSWATEHVTWAGWVHHSWRFEHAEALREVGPEILERGSKTSTVSVVWATFRVFSARSKWFPVAIGDHGRNLVISLWPGDKATINGVAAQRLTPPQKIPSAKIRWKSSSLNFFGSRRHLPHWLSSKEPNYQNGVLLCWCNWRTFWRKNAAGRSRMGPCSFTTVPRLTGHTCNPEETGLPVSWSPTVFSGSGSVGLSPVPWTEKTIARSQFFFRLGGHCCRGDLVGRTTFWTFFWVACKS